MADGIELGKAYVQIVPSAQGITGSISSVLNGEAASAGDSAEGGLDVSLCSHQSTWVRRSAA